MRPRRIAAENTPGALTSGVSFPPVQFFWSMTMDDLPERHLVANAINRYYPFER